MAPTGEEASEWKMKHTWISLFFFFFKENKKKIKTFALDCEWKNQTGNRRLRVRVDVIS